MKNKLNLVLVLGILLLIGSACSFTTANLSEVSFAKDEAGKDKITSANGGEKIYAISSVNNTSDKFKVKWEVAKPNGEAIEIPQNEVAVEGSRPVWFTLTVPPNFPSGDYKFTITMTNESDGKQIDKKTGTINIKTDGSASEAPADGNSNAEETEETEETKEDAAKE